MTFLIFLSISALTELATSASAIIANVHETIRKLNVALADAGDDFNRRLFMSPNQRFKVRRTSEIFEEAAMELIKAIQDVPQSQEHRSEAYEMSSADSATSLSVIRMVDPTDGLVEVGHFNSETPGVLV